MTSRFKNPFPQYFDDNGQILVAGRLYFYEPGTSNIQRVYQDQALSSQHPDYVTLTGAGRVPDIFFSGYRRVVLTDSSGNEVDEADPVDLFGKVQFNIWGATIDYGVGDIAQDPSDSDFYISLTNNNNSNDPSGSPTHWSKIIFIGIYNSNETYAADNVVADGGILYFSLVNNNIGNTPASSPSQWSSFASSAANTTYDNAASGLAAITVQAAIDELESEKAVKANPSFTGEISLVGTSVSETELSILEGATISTAELNTLDGITATTAELNTLDGITATTAELNTLDGITATTAELNHSDGLTSNIQSQINAKLASSSDSISAYWGSIRFVSGTTASADQESGLSITWSVPATGVYRGVFASARSASTYCLQGTAQSASGAATILTIYGNGKTVNGFDLYNLNDSGAAKVASHNYVTIWEN